MEPCGFIIYKETIVVMVMDNGAMYLSLLPTGVGGDQRGGVCVWVAVVSGRDVLARGNLAGG
jgi:hypothetical protein